MDLRAILDDLSIIQSHIFIHPNEAARRWTKLECDDYQLPLAGIIGFLSNAVPPVSRASIPVGSKPGHKVMIEIIMNSTLHELLEHDSRKNLITYRKNVADSIKEQIAKFLDEHAEGFELR